MKHPLLDALAVVAVRRIAHGADPQEVLTALRRYLQRTRREALLRPFGRALREYARDLARKETAILRVAREDEMAQAREEARALLAKWSGGADVAVIEVVDPTLIRGWQFVWRDRRFDRSTRRVVLAFYQSLRTAARTASSA